MITMTGYLRKNANRPALTGRDARRATQRHKARTFAREHSIFRVITHHDRAVVAASRAGF